MLETVSLISSNAFEEQRFRLRHDAQMHWVWKELNKPTRRLNHDHVWLEVLRPFTGKLDPPLHNKGMAGEMFLATAVFLSMMKDHLENLISTEAELRQQTESFQCGRDQCIANLRAVAADLRYESVAERFGDFISRQQQRTSAPDYHGESRALSEQYAQAMERVAEFLERDQVKLGRPVVARDSGNRQVRAFVILLARETKALFGEVLLKIVATTTNVALNLTDEQKISGDDVRNWTRPPRPRAPKN